MKFIELAQIRKSVRRYLDKPVPREIIDRCAEAARIAPSACNCQPWQFLIIDNKDEIQKLADKAFSGAYARTSSFIREAPALIIVLNKKSDYVARLFGFLRGVQYSLIDIGIASEHFVLQAREEGVGTCYVGWFNDKAIKKWLKLPRNTSVEMLISMGYPDKDDGSRNKPRKNLDEVRKYLNKD